jgi:hypothetical protein
MGGLVMLDFYIPKTKKEFINWLYWFYDGKISKYQISKKNVKGWYYRLRLNNVRKPVKLSAKTWIKKTYTHRVLSSIIR